MAQVPRKQFISWFENFMNRFSVLVVIFVLAGTRTLAAESDLTCPEFFKILKDPVPAASIADTLKRVQKVNPRFLLRYTLAYRSRSLHESSFEFPRAIVYGKDARLILTFNGSPNQRGYERLEVMCFDDGLKAFQFFDVAFPREAISPEVLDDLTAEEKLQLNVVSAPNGRPGTGHNCLACHQTPARPNWDSYPVWPGLYGSDADRVFQPDRKAKTFIDVAEIEKTAWIQFQKNQLHSGRYAYLGTLKPQATPNQSLARALAPLNAERIVRELHDLKDRFKAVAPEFEKALFGNDRLEIAKNVFSCASDSAMFLRFNTPTKPEMATLYSQRVTYEISRIQLAAGLLESPTVPAQTSCVSTQIPPFLNSAFGIDFLNPAELNWVQTPDIQSRIFQNSEAELFWRLGEMVKPLGIDPTNWSMVFTGGSEFETGPTHTASTFAEHMQRAYSKEFFNHAEKSQFQRKFR